MSDMPQWVVVIMALTGGGGIKFLWDYFVKSKDASRNENRSDNQRLIQNLEEQLRKSEEEISSLKEGYKMAETRIQTLNKKANELEVSKVQIEVEMKYLEESYTGLQARYKVAL
jgi:chromosome segregation ATPase